MTTTENVENLGDRSVFTCPDCGGSLWQMQHGNVLRYRCHAGHAYVAETVLNDKEKQLEETLWIAMRILEERKNMLITLADQLSSESDAKSLYIDKIKEVDMHVNRIKDIILHDIHVNKVLKNNTNT